MSFKFYFFCIHLLSIFIGLFNKKKYIIFESFPDFTGSPKRICQDLDKRGFGSKYTFIWAVDKNQKNSLGSYKTIPFWGNLNFIDRLKKNFTLANAILIIDSNRYIQKIKSETLRLHTRHGGTLKRVDDYSNGIGNIDYILSLCSEMASLERAITYQRANLKKDQFLLLGYPSNDELFNPIKETTKETLNKELNISHCNKIIGWLPTYREHKVSEMNVQSIRFPQGVPLLYDVDSFKKVNDILKKNDILLILKQHHAQALPLKASGFSNIKIVSDDLLNNLKISVIDLALFFDALITDYSSLYYEFLLLNRPIALTIDDYDEYSKDPGFCIDYFDWIKGVYLKTTPDLIQFINNIAKGLDLAKGEREKTKLRIHKYTDNLSTKRVVDFLIENVKL